MSDGLSKLKGVGAQKIHERTHIARQHVQAVLHESFDDMTKIQLLGFISILEREYSVDLSELREKAKDFYPKEVQAQDQDAKFFVTTKRKKNYTLVYIAVVALIFAVAVYFTLDLTSTTSSKVDSHAIDNSAINNAKDSMSQNDIIEDKNASENVSIDANTTSPEIVEVKPEALEVAKSFKIIANSKLWIGYIDLSNHKKYQKLFTGELEIDPNKDWILTLGHGYVDVEINGKVTEFKDKLNIRLLYKDANLSKITFKEFKELNKGSKW